MIVKVKTVKPSVLKNQIRQIKDYIITDEIDIPEWDSYTGIHTRPGEIILDDKPHEIMKVGSRWYAGYDDTRFFDSSVTVPDEFDGKKFYLFLNFGGESIVRVNGKIIGALSADSGWRSRNIIIFDHKAAAGEKLDISVEATVDCGLFCDKAMAGAKAEEYQIKETKLVAVDEKCESYYFDVSTAFEVFETTDDEYVKPRLYNAVYSSVHKLSFDLGQKAFLDSVEKADEEFWNEINKIDYATPGKVIMDGHSHLDVAWLWTVNEITRKSCRTFANNIALMKNYPDFRFTQSEAVVYSFVKDYYPEVYEQVKEKVKSGQWEIVGNAWVEADTNIASGESLIRQLLYGREFFKKEFGVVSDVYWLPDCFGFTWALPQIIKRSGMKYFVTSKLTNNDTNEFPLSVFKWRSHSGDEVIAYMMKMSYESEYDAEYVKEIRKRNRQNDVVDASFGMFGYGDGGGGCTFRQVEEGRRLSKLPGIVHSEEGSVSEFFKEIEKDADKLPVWDGEMYYENHRGTFTSQAFIKKNNRRGEFMLRNAEILGLMAGDYDAEKLEKTWKILLLNQFHDILPGTSIHEVIVNTRKRYEQMNELGNEMISSSIQSILSNAKIENDSVAVFNMNTFETGGIVTCEVESKDLRVVDSDGNILPYRFEEKDGKTYISFFAPELMPMGLTLFEIDDGDNSNGETNSKTSGGNKYSDIVAANERFIENKYLRVELDEDGNIESVYDKENGTEVLTGKGNILSVSMDKPVHESAWNLECDYKDNMTFLDKADSIELIESSSLRGVVRTVHKYHESVITQDIILERDSRTLDFETTVDWHEREKVLKAQFPVSVRSRYATYEIQHGTNEYPTHSNTTYDAPKFECCAHKWADLSEGGYGVSLINDSKYGYDIQDNLMRITLMRGPICPDPLGDIGINTFRYSLYPHKLGWRQSDVIKLALKENNRPYAVFAPWNSTSSEKFRPFVSISSENDNIVLDAVKKAQDGHGIILRVYEAENIRTSVSITLDRIFTEVFETNMMEENERRVPVFDDSFTFKIKPNEVKTFRII